jgi:organic hydroperoxide reductase OsmC/OhrA
MSEYAATVSWERQPSEAFVDNRYSRAHRWSFDGGATVPASSSPHSVKVPLSDPTGVDPEEAFVASLSSCHMLWFLSLAARKGFLVESYVDNAIGHLERDAGGRLSMTRVTLRPKITFGGDKRPAAGELEALHASAHHECFIANSVKTVVTVE